MIHLTREKLSIALCAGVLLYAAGIGSIGPATARPLSSVGKADMAKCNSGSKSCNDRCQNTYDAHQLNSEGLGKCQDRCDTNFANCVGRVGSYDSGKTTGQPPKGKRPVNDLKPVSVDGSKQTSGSKQPVIERGSGGSSKK